MEKLVDKLAFEIGLSGINDNMEEKIEQHLQKQQEKRKFKDAGKRTGWSRKERAAYATIINTTDLSDIEKDEATAIELIQKKRVWPKVDVSVEQDNGVDSGCAFIKHLLQQKYPAKPLKNTEKQRKVYVSLAEAIQAILKEAVTLNDLRNDLPSLVQIYNAYIKEPDAEPETWANVRKLLPYFPKVFLNIYYSAQTGGRTSKSVSNNFDLAYQYNGLTKEIADKNFDRVKENVDRYIKRQQKVIDELKYVSTVRDMIIHRKDVLTFSGGLLPEYIRHKDVPGYVKYVNSVITRWINEQKLRLTDKRAWDTEEHAPDWSWATTSNKQQATSTKKPAEISINTGIPLSFIKRVGGIEITDISEKEIISRLGFKGVTLGNYIKDVEAKEHIRHFLGAIADLVEILNFDTKYINKPLSIGFGAYGRGGKAMATYYPTLQAINLTKRRGDGTVCHEWGHYFDNFMTDFNNIGFYGSAKAMEMINTQVGSRYMRRYFNKKSSRYSVSSSFPSEKINDAINSQSNIAAKEMIRIMGFIRFGEKINVDQNNGMFTSTPKRLSNNKSNYYYNSAKMRSKYWINDQELFARAWETYIFDKLQKQKRVNNYLVSGGHFDSPVYPQGEEREMLYELYDNLVAAVKKVRNIPDFKPWTTKRNDEYIALDDKSDTEKVTTGVIVNLKPNTKDQQPKTKDRRIRLAKAKAKAKLKLLELIKI